MGEIITRQARALGSAIDLQIACDGSTTGGEAEAALDEALVAIEAAEARLSRFRPTSELCALNRAAGAWFAASDALFAIVERALTWAQRTGGLFEPTILHSLEDLGYDRDFAEMEGRPHPPVWLIARPYACNACYRRLGFASAGFTPSLSDDGEGEHGNRISGILPSLRSNSGNFRDVRLDPGTRGIWLPAGVGIDLGGIGKGWIADEVSERVLGHCANVLVNLGGDLRVRGGPAPGTGWVIAARDPRNEGADPPVYLGGVELRAGGIATSGAAWRWWLQSGEPVHHLIDPRTGTAATMVSITASDARVLAATALAGTATEAEVLAKYALLLGMMDGLHMLDQGSEHAGWFILGNGGIVASANLRDYLAAHGSREG